MAQQRVHEIPAVRALQASPGLGSVRAVGRSPLHGLVGVLARAPKSRTAPIRGGNRGDISAQKGGTVRVEASPGPSIEETAIIRVKLRSSLSAMAILGG